MKRYFLVVLAAALGVVAAPAAGSTDIHSPKAQISTKQAPKALSGGAVAETAGLKKCLKKANRIDDPVKRKKAKKKCKKRFAKPPYVPPPPPPPTPLALTDSEVRSQVNQKASEYCSVDPYCYAYGIYVEYSGGPIACSSKSTYSWSCYGWNDEYDGFDFYTCDFREIVERDGYNGIKSHQDLSYGSGGWVCL